jgi:hypothetical protein
MAASHLNVLILIIIAMIIVVDVKYARVSTSIHTVNLRCAQNTNPNNPIAFDVITSLVSMR